MLRASMWLIAEYATNLSCLLFFRVFIKEITRAHSKDIQLAFKKVRLTIGDLPIVQTDHQYEPSSLAAADALTLKTSSPLTPPPPSMRSRVLPDGTYATESAFSNSVATDSSSANAILNRRPPLRGTTGR